MLLQELLLETPGIIERAARATNPQPVLQIHEASLSAWEDLGLQTTAGENGGKVEASGDVTSSPGPINPASAIVSEVCLRLSLYAWICLCARECVHACVRACASVCVCVCARAQCQCMCLCVCFPLPSVF